MSIPILIKRYWYLFRWFGFGFCTIDNRTQLLTITKRDRLMAFIISFSFIVASWYFCVTIILNQLKKDEDSKDQAGSNTTMAVSMISFFSEQFCNTLLVPLTLIKQSKFMEVINRIYRLDLSLDDHLPQFNGKVLRKLFICTLVSLTVFGSFITISSGITKDSWIAAFFQAVATIRPLVSDCVNLQFIGTVLMIESQIRRVSLGIKEGQLPLNKECDIHQILFTLEDTVKECNIHFSWIFLIQSIRVLVTFEQVVYQLIQYYVAGVLFEYWLFIVLFGSFYFHTFGVYIAMVLICHRTGKSFQELSNSCNAKENSDGRLSLHLMSLRNQRHGHGLGFTAFGESNKYPCHPHALRIITLSFHCHGTKSPPYPPPLLHPRCLWHPKGTSSFPHHLHPDQCVSFSCQLPRIVL